MMTEKVYKVKDQDRFVRHIAEYTNGIETTGGFYSIDELEPADNAISITYDSVHCTELPVGWPRIWFLDDKNKRQRIKDIDYENDIAFIMEDGSRSLEVTE